MNSDIQQMKCLRLVIIGAMAEASAMNEVRLLMADIKAIQARASEPEIGAAAVVLRFLDQSIAAEERA